MKTLAGFEAVQTAQAYEALLKALYAGVKRQVEELEIPPVPVISVTGKEPPGGKQYQDAVGVLYGIGYTLKMGLKYEKLARPTGYFDYKVGALETLWWSEGGPFEIGNAATLRWQAYLMVPAYVSEELFAAARESAGTRNPGLPYGSAVFTTVEEGRCVQVLHVGPYDQEQATIERLHAHAADQGLARIGKHHEIYISDPRRTPPEKLKTVIRIGVQPA